MQQNANKCACVPSWWHVSDTRDHCSFQAVCRGRFGAITLHGSLGCHAAGPVVGLILAFGRREQVDQQCHSEPNLWIVAMRKDPCSPFELVVADWTFSRPVQWVSNTA
jgi:hypothetical protein